MNRIWQRYFGVGLVATENDFGTQGERPTHPKLLDWLADELRQSGWSIKHIHRLIVSSATYRQSSHERPEYAELDPANKLLARQRRLRLPAENVRDALLSVSGLLSRKVGGPSVFPYQPDGVMKVRRSPRKWEMSSGADRYRRGLYTHFWRTSPHPFLTTFDAPLSDVTCTRRSRSNTPLQALMLLNDPEFLEAARAFARRILSESPDAARVSYAFRVAFGREPNATERESIERFLHLQLEAFADDPDAAAELTAGAATDPDVREWAAWTAVARVLLNLDEFITRE